MSNHSAETFLNVDDTEDALGVPAIGFVPLVEKDEQRLIRDVHTFSPLTECYRSLRTQLRFVVDQPLRSLVVTSAVPAEGKSTTLANLAIALGMDNKRVIVVDADLRRPAQHKLFLVKSSPGLTDVLAGTHAVRDALRPTSVANVSIIPAGTPPPNPAELLGSDAMGRLLTELKKLCDIVLLDSPPALAVSDAQLIASHAESALVVVAQGETKKVHVHDTMKLLRRARATVVGTVLNRIEGGAAFYYYKYYSPSVEEATAGAAETATDKPATDAVDAPTVTA